MSPIKFILFPFRLLRFSWRFLVSLVNFLTILSVILSLFLTIALFSFNLWFPSVAKWYVAHKSGFRLRIGQSSCALCRGRSVIDFNRIEIRNPEGKFSQEGCLKFDRLMARANLLTVFNPEIVIDEVVLGIERVICEKGADGEMNVWAFQNAFSVLDESDLGALPRRRRRAKRRSGGEEESAVEKAAPKANGAGDSGPLKFFAQNGGRFVIRKMTIRMGSFELHNITAPGEKKEIDVNQTWTLTDVRSRKDVVDFVMARLQSYGLGIVLQSALGAIFNLPGMKLVKHGMEKVSHLGRGVFKGVGEAMTRILPHERTPASADGSGKGDRVAGDVPASEGKKAPADSDEKSETPLIE